MRILFLLSFITLSIVSGAATAPTNNDPRPKFSLKHITSKNIEKYTGKKLTIPQKIQLLLLKWKLKNYVEDDPMTEKQKDQATTSMIMGIASFAFLFLPIVVYLSIPLAILAIIFGIKSLKGNSNTKGIVGVSFGAATILLLLIVIAVVASGGFWV